MTFLFYFLVIMTTQINQEMIYKILPCRKVVNKIKYGNTLYEYYLVNNEMEN